MTRPATYAALVRDTDPPPFDWDRHNREQAQRMADLMESIERWRKAADAIGKDA